MATAQPTAAEEWRINWLLVASAMAGISFGTIPTATLGLFMEPLQGEFGWSRTEISAGLTLFAIVSLPLTPFAGVLVDKVGARRVAIPGLALSGLMFAAFGLIGDSIAQWLTVWFGYTLASLLTRTLVWNSAVSGAFSTSRGFAIAVLLCGTALASAIAPSVTHALIEGYGWRGAYAGLGIGWGGIALLLVTLFLNDRRGGPKDPNAATRAPPPARVGLTVPQALRNPILYRIAVAMFIQAVMGAAVLVHLVPMLTAGGLSRAEAAGIAAVLGIASLTGKLVTGWLTDRYTGSLIPVTVFAGPALAYTLLLQAGGSTPLITVAIAVLGYCSGAALHQTTYLTTRYGGLRSFGTIFGFISSLMAFAGGIGPLVGGAIYDSTGSYTLLLMGGIPLAIMAGIAVFGLGPFPVFAQADTVRDEGAVFS